MIHPFLFLDNEGDRPASQAKPRKQLVQSPYMSKEMESSKLFQVKFWSR